MAIGRRLQRTGYLGIVLAVCMLPSGCSLIGRREETPEALLGRRRLMVPVSGVTAGQVADTFDAPRDGGRRRHRALDIMAPAGTPVLSADDGLVLKLRRSRRGGITLYATDPDRELVYYYAHLARYAAGIREGTPLRRGDVIGYVGTTGNAEGPHLHFQVTRNPKNGRYWDGEPINPHPYFASAPR